MNANLLAKTLAELQNLIADLQQIERLLQAGDAKGACLGYFDMGDVTSHGEIHPTTLSSGLCYLAEQQQEEESLTQPQE